MLGEEFKLENTKYLWHGWILFVSLFFMIGFIVYDWNKRGYISMLLVLIMSGLFLLQFIPWLLLHNNYFKANKGDTFYYDIVADQMVFIHKNGKKICFTIDDVSKVKRFVSIPYLNKSMPMLAWDSYNHTIIYFKDGSNITITSLLVPDLQLPIDPNLVEVKKGPHRWVKYPSWVQNTSSVT